MLANWACPSVWRGPSKQAGKNRRNNCTGEKKEHTVSLLHGRWLNPPLPISFILIPLPLSVYLSFCASFSFPPSFLLSFPCTQFSPHPLFFLILFLLLSFCFFPYIIQVCLNYLAAHSYSCSPGSKALPLKKVPDGLLHFLKTCLHMR